ncbi:hypothetical protein, partial [Curtobacterium sp. MMLR14_002]|uniref:hypothetical protein n=1 Tax=Curtobacterium sp. MMLR14_002 TaxID=1898741 RepID=UPI001495D8EE
ASVITHGASDILKDQVAVVLPNEIVGWATIAVAGLLIFWAQFGYQLAKSYGWTWASNLKWPF